jgi:hypothetical protein
MEAKYEKTNEPLVCEVTKDYEKNRKAMVQSIFKEIPL